MQGKRIIVSTVSPLCRLRCASRSLAAVTLPAAASQLLSSSSMTCSTASSSMTGCRRSFHTLTRPLQQSWAKVSSRPWMCPKESCRTVNKAFMQTCEACDEERPQRKGWKCIVCETRNHQGIKKCKQCAEPVASSSKFWMCTVCEKNNRVDDIEDNSRCGHCGYDMAPSSKTEEDMHEIQQKRAMSYQSQQEAFDSVSAREAEDQLGHAEAGAETLPHAITAKGGKKLNLPKMQPFMPKAVVSSHSKIHRKSRTVVPSVAMPAGPPGFDWMCRAEGCGGLNPGDEEACVKCGVHIKPEEWECQECAALNHLSRSRCFSCQTPIPASWLCRSCQGATSIYDTKCVQCGETRTAVEPKAAQEVRKNAEVKARGPVFREDWHCDACSAMNFARRQECFQCGSARPAAGGPLAAATGWSSSTTTTTDSSSSSSWSSPESARSNQQNWRCRACQSSNFRTRKTCWQCGEASPTGWRAETNESAVYFDREGFQDSKDSKPAEGKMNSWSKEDDWTCAKCFSKNFKSRADCFKCGASKAIAVSSRRASVRKPVKL